MKQYKYLFFLFIIFLTSCKHNSNKKKEIEFGEIKSILKQKNNKKDIRGSALIKFKDNDTLTIASNFFTEYKIDSISTLKKDFKAKYYYCGKGNVNLKLFEFLKTKNPQDFTKLESINTAHNIIINRDTLYLLGRENVNCYKKNDRVNIKTTIYRLYYMDSSINILIIDKIRKKENI